MPPSSAAPPPPATNSGHTNSSQSPLFLNFLPLSSFLPASRYSLSTNHSFVHSFDPSGNIWSTCHAPDIFLPLFLCYIHDRHFKGGVDIYRSDEVFKIRKDSREHIQSPRAGHLGCLWRSALLRSTGRDVFMCFLFYYWVKG